MAAFNNSASAMRMRVPGGGLKLGRSRAAVPTSANGSVHQNVDPLPAALSRPISPPILSTSSRLIASPRPVPPKRRVVEASACENLRNNCARASSEMPMPVSSTEMRTIAFPSRRPVRFISINTCPRAVNFRAFPVRFMSTCRTRAASPITNCGVLGPQRIATSMPFSCAAGAINSPTSATTASRSKERDSITSLPASIFEKSRMSFKIVSNASAELFAVAASSRCSAFSRVSSSSEVMPSTPFMGVRIS